ncbi:MAG: HEAT repeat domain-containing protein [Deltaproteobacteria bacterium]|jgi:HEAT repeat protein|nr:HEAT repeat domain-containing protein [Deltaproteobacteria bacterium]
MKKRFKTLVMFLVMMGFAPCIFLTDAAGQAGNSDNIDQIIKDLQNDSWQIRWDAAAALGETKDPRGIDPLSTALKDENSYVRMTAARSLGMIDDLRVIEPLIQALRDQSHGVQKNALLSLKERTGQDFGKDPDAWQKWWEQNK